MPDSLALKPVSISTSKGVNRHWMVCREDHLTLLFARRVLQAHNQRLNFTQAKKITGLV